jgi:hypothetical protein
LTGRRWSGLLVGKQVIELWHAMRRCDSARAIDFLDIFGDSASKAVFSATLKAQHNQSYTPDRWRCFLSCRPDPSPLRQRIYEWLRRLVTSGLMKLTLCHEGLSRGTGLKMRSFDIDFLETYDDDSILSELKRIASSGGQDTMTKADIERVGHVSY